MRQVILEFVAATLVASVPAVAVVRGPMEVPMVAIEGGYLFDWIGRRISERPTAAQCYAQSVPDRHLRDDQRTVRDLPQHS